MSERTQLAMLGASSLVRVPNVAAQAKPAAPGATSISQPYKIYFPSGVGKVRGIRAGVLQAMTRDFEKAALTCLSIRIQASTKQGTRELFVTGQGEGYILLDSIVTWVKLQDIEFDSSLPWTLYVQNEDLSTSGNASYTPYVELAVSQGEG